MTQPTGTKEFDDKLKSNENFHLRPFLLPFIGKNMDPEYGILFLVESHYTDPDFFQHQYDKNNLKKENPELFYNVEANNLTVAFKEYLNTRQIIIDAASQDPKKGKGKSVYRKLDAVVKESLKLNDSDGAALEQVAIFNYFQRPSYKPGASIKLCAKDEDVAYETLCHFVKNINIDKIVFTSAKAYDSFRRRDEANKKQIQNKIKTYRGTHPRVWGNACPYVNGKTWRQWVIDRLSSD